MTASHYLNNQLLIAMPALADNNFSHTVSYLCQHNEEGALAITINRPSNMSLADIFKQMGIETSSTEIKQTPIFVGGPVQQERGFIIHTNGAENWDSSIPVSDDISLTSSRDILEAIADNKGPEHYLIALGYAGWGAGQLEREILNNAWLNVPFQHDILYTTPINHRWAAAANKIGIDINKLTTTAGYS